jgi:hypothetical protein
MTRLDPQKLPGTLAASGVVAADAGATILAALAVFTAASAFRLTTQNGLTHLSTQKIAHGFFADAALALQIGKRLRAHQLVDIALNVRRVVGSENAEAERERK